MNAAFHHWLTVLGGAIKRVALGKSSGSYMKQFTGGDEFWDALVAGSPRTHPEEGPHVPVAETCGDRDRSGCADRAACPGAADCEPVHGWTRRQFDAYMTRNPSYLPAYDAELRKHRGWPVSGNGSRTGT